MTKIPIKKILAQARSDYEKAWLDSKKYLQLTGRKFELKKNGKAHPLREMMEEARHALINLGFEELVLPMFVDEKDVYKEYGPEAALILDRLYYLAELPRPDIGVSQAKIDQIKTIIPTFDDIKGLQAIFRRYKKGEIEADDLIEVMILELGIEESEATAIIDKVFPEFKSLRPIPTKTTLRSHTTALWFLVLEQMVKKKPLPLQYFIVGPKFRREQKQDATHLFVSNTLSIVIAAEDITLEDGKEIGRQIAQAIGFDKVDVHTKTATSKYYAPQTEFEIFVQHPITKDWIEIGDGGFYSPVSLANYNIDVPVLNIGFGCERITMIRTQETDIRKLVYPYFYQDLYFSDEELASLLYFLESPNTDECKKLIPEIKKEIIAHKSNKGPIEIVLYNGELFGEKIEILSYEPDNNASLLGKAALNKIWIKNGKILSSSFDSELEGAIPTNITYLDGLINKILYQAEQLILYPQSNQHEYDLRVKFIKRPAEVNIGMDEKVRMFMSANDKKIDVKGPVFIGLKVRKVVN